MAPPTMPESAAGKKETSGRPARERNTPVSFLDDTWSWSSPSTWPLSVRFLPFPIACIVVFFGVYIQHFLYPASALDICLRDFDHSIPISKIEALAVDLATHDWEQGTAAEALLELYNPEHSVFGQIPFTKHAVPSERAIEDKAIQYVLPKMHLPHRRLSNNTWGVSDPASLGVFAVLASAARHGSDSLNVYKYAAEQQADFLLDEAPRYANGAISHRMNVAELWSDAIFMFPPFLAYLAVLPAAEPDKGQDGQRLNRSGTQLMKLAVEQIGLYRDVLSITEGEHTGAWKHIVGPSEMADAGAWSTGNGWAAYGMARVRATLAGWAPGAHLLQPQIASLDTWMAEIIDAAIRTDNHESGLLRNYLGDDAWFGETAGTALIAAAAYRLASFLEPGEQRQGYVTWANRKREAVFGHVGADGIAKPAVNSLKHNQREPLDGPNPEGESFLLLLASAWRDCVCADICAH